MVQIKKTAICGTDIHIYTWDEWAQATIPVPMTVGHEFYGDFGAFDVELTFASNFVVGATGFLTNRAEVLPGELRNKLDIKNFAEKTWNSRPSIITPYDSTQRKTWKYHAENVHDFAFTADPTYRIGEANWDGVTCYSLAQEPHASKWQNAAEYAAKVIQVFSTP